MKKIYLAILALFFILCTFNINASTHIVTSVSDSGVGSIREAISLSINGDTIIFADSLVGQPIVLLNGELKIGKDISILGNDSLKTVISGNNNSRIFHLDDSVHTINLLIKDLKLVDGQAEYGGAINIQDNDVKIVKSHFANNSADSSGGAVFLDYGSHLEIDSSFFELNYANANSNSEGGGAIYNNGGNLIISGSTEFKLNNATGACGGAIFNGINGNLNLNQVTISNNTAYISGGGIEDVSGRYNTLNFISVNLDSNSANSSQGIGGGLHLADSGHISFIGGTISGNDAMVDGGGIYNDAGKITIRGTRIDMNIASGNTYNHGGGGIFNSNGSLFINSNAVIKENSSSGYGGGIFNYYGDSVLIDSTILIRNTAVINGGGIYNRSDSIDVLVLKDISIDSNMARSGGGFYISGGNVEIESCSFMGNQAIQSGGGLLNAAYKITLNQVEFVNNSTNGTITFIGTGGGAIYNSFSRIEISKCYFYNNTSHSYGGAIKSFDDKGVIIDSSSFIANQASDGGAIFILQNPSTLDSLYISNSILDSNSSNSSGAIRTLINSAQTVTSSIKVIIENSKFRHNSGSSGGAIFNDKDKMRIKSVLLDSNTSSSNGGAIFNNGGSLEIMNSSITNNSSLTTPNVNYSRGGGGIFNYNDGRLSVFNSTISSNYSTNHGGGILNRGYTLIKLSTITENIADSTGGGYVQGNSTDSLEVSSSIVANNIAQYGFDVLQTAGVINSLGYNLIGVDDASVINSMNGDLIGSPSTPVNPMLDTLEIYQNTTKVHKLKCGSPAIDAADSSFNDTDQVGGAVFNNRRDIGAFEVQSCGLVGVEEELKSRVSLSSQIYPNPLSSKKLKIVIPEDFGKNVQVYITNLSGNRVLSQNYYDAGIHSLDLSSLNAAVYVVKVVGKKKSESHKLILR